MPHPVIGIVSQSHPPLPGQSTPCWSVGQRYAQVIAATGGLPWPISLVNDESILRGIFDQLHGLLLTGGSDVGPASYGEDRHELCQTPDADRDRVEFQLVRWAVAEGKPVFGVCRGMQTINVALGGTLYQDVDLMHPQAIKHDYFTVPGGPYRRDQLAHDVMVKAGSRLGQILGAERLAVNSLHHQAIKKLAQGLTATAWSPDGLIEGVEAGGAAFLVGVQWHPEELTDTAPAMRRLFTAFIDAATMVSAGSQNRPGSANRR